MARRPAKAASRESKQPGPRPVDAPVDPRLLRAQRLCAQRAFRERDVSIRRVVGDLARQARRDMDRAGTAAEAWSAEMPAAVVAETWIEQAGPAQLVVGVPSAAVAFAVDRALRLGALAAIRLRMQAPGLRVRTRVGRQPGA